MKSGNKNCGDALASKSSLTKSTKENSNSRVRIQPWVSLVDKLLNQSLSFRQRQVRENQVPARLRNKSETSQSNELSNSPIPKIRKTKSNLQRGALTKSNLQRGERGAGSDVATESNTNQNSNSPLAIENDSEWQKSEDKDNQNQIGPGDTSDSKADTKTIDMRLMNEQFQSLFGNVPPDPTLGQKFTPTEIANIHIQVLRLLPNLSSTPDSHTSCQITVLRTFLKHWAIFASQLHIARRLFLFWLLSVCGAYTVLLKWRFYQTTEKLRKDSPLSTLNRATGDAFLREERARLHALVNNNSGESGCIFTYFPAVSTFLLQYRDEIQMLVFFLFHCVIPLTIFYLGSFWEDRINYDSSWCGGHGEENCCQGDRGFFFGEGRCCLELEDNRALAQMHMVYGADKPLNQMVRRPHQLTKMMPGSGMPRRGLKAQEETPSDAGEEEFEAEVNSRKQVSRAPLMDPNYAYGAYGAVAEEETLGFINDNRNLNLNLDRRLN